MSAESAARERASGFALRVYKLVIAPVLHAISPSRCIYVPTCSEYASLAVARFGVFRGSWLALRRLARCHPWGRGGFDPIPVRPEGAEHCGNLADANSVQHKSGR